MAGQFEYADKVWQRFRLQRLFGVTGGAARLHLGAHERGVLVPPVAFDLCETLQLRLQSLAAERPCARVA
jgi:hypothetical protein